MIDGKGFCVQVSKIAGSTLESLASLAASSAAVILVSRFGSMPGIVELILAWLAVFMLILTLLWLSRRLFLRSSCRVRAAESLSMVVREAVGVADKLYSRAGEEGEPRILVSLIGRQYEARIRRGRAKNLVVEFKMIGNKKSSF
ncbi:MAG: hypothetical protein F7C07_07755 [Desulfurococcales archaeon]|nr:hypothetical protein [Desulfurococcales archaeon]